MSKKPAPKDFYCPDCIKAGKLVRKFASQASLQRHRQNLHLGSYKCQRCRKEFANGYDLTHHTRVAHGRKSTSFIHPLTGELFDSKRKVAAEMNDSSFQMLEIDEAGAPGSSMACAYCGAVQGSRTALLDHLAYSHESDLDAMAGNREGLDGEAARARVRGALLEEGLQPDEEGGDEEDADEALRRQLLLLIHRRPLRFVSLSQHHSLPKSPRFGFGGVALEIRLNDLGDAAVFFGCSLSLLERILEHLLEKIAATVGASSGILVSFALESPQALSFPITSPFIGLSEFSVRQFIAEISLVGSSRPALFLHNSLKITLSYLGANAEPTQPRLFGSFKQKHASLEASFLLKPGFGSMCRNRVYSHDCGLVALYLGIVHRRKGAAVWARNLAASKSPKPSPSLNLAVLRLAKEFPAVDWNQPQGPATCQQMQSFLNEKHKLQLLIYEDFDSKRTYFQGYPIREHKSRINLLIHQGHLFYLESVEKFFNVHSCDGCLKLYEKGKHRVCLGRGKRCFDCKTQACIRDSKFVDGASEPLFCSDCHVCLAHHKSESEEGAEGEGGLKLPVCRFFVFCQQCGRRLERSEEAEAPHGCLEALKCRQCGAGLGGPNALPHYCSIQKASLGQLGISSIYAQELGLLTDGHIKGRIGKRPKPSLPSEPQPTPGPANLHLTYRRIVGPASALVFIDLETRVSGPHNQLVPYLGVAVFVCSLCAFEDFDLPKVWKDEYPCCGKRIRTYETPEQIKKMILKIFFGMTKFKRVTCMAFYGSGFDFAFFLRILVDNGHKPAVTMRGRNILRLQLGKVVCKDLLLYISSSLAKLPAHFGFADQIGKGFFPHLLSNVVNNDFRSASWPGLAFFGPEKIRSPDELDELKAFLKEKDGQPFVFMEEAKRYCALDTVILTIAALSIEAATLSETHYQISLLFSSSFTLASLASIFYRHQHMKPRSLGLIPSGGYFSDLQSLPATIFFKWLNRNRRARGLEEIRYSGSSLAGEERVIKFKLDGSTSKEIIEYDSCFYHGSACCYSKQSLAIHPVYRLPYKDVRYLDLLRKKKIELATGKRVITVNHCKIEELRRTNPAYRSFYEEERKLISSQKPISIRDSLFGGRVENLATVVELTQSEIQRGVTLDLVDVVSLYPACQYGLEGERYPTQLHPVLVHGHELPHHGFNFSLSQAREIFGVYSLVLLPPTRLLFPSIPYRVGQKTFYGLCRKCMESAKQEACHHKLDSERSFQCTLNSIDTEQALADGYRILRIHSVLDYNAKNTTEDLFKPIIGSLIRGKVQSKPGVEKLTAEEKSRMVEAWRKIGINLDGPWQPSSARYLFYKILLNRSALS